MKSTLSYSLAALLILGLTTLPQTLALENGLARTPQMGWNSWNKFGCNITAETIKSSAD